MIEFSKVGEVIIPPDAQTAAVINLALREMHGRDINQDRPRFRIVWSTVQSEVRYGTYSVFYKETIFLRDETGFANVAKYPAFPDRWILEMLVFNPIKEIPETKNGHYEVLYVFQGPAQQYLPPLHSVAETVIWSIKNPDKNLVEYLERKDRETYKREIEYYMDVLEDTGGSVLVTALHDKEAVTVPHNYETREYNNTGVTKL